MYPSFVLAQGRWSNSIVKLVRVRDARGKYLVKSAERIGRWPRTQPQPYGLAAARGYFKAIIRGRFSARLVRIHRVPIARNYIIVKRILDIRRRVRLSPKTSCVGLIFRKQQLRIPIAIKRAVTQLGMRRQNRSLLNLAYRRFGLAVTPRPGIAEPESWEQMKLRCLSTAIVY